MVRAKIEQRNRAIKLRKQGRSIVEISNLIGVNRGSVSRWCANILLTDKQMALLRANSKSNILFGNAVAAEKNKRGRQARQATHQARGVKDVGTISERELFLIGAALYLAEGGKTTRSINFANSDPDVIRVFIRWLITCCKIDLDKIKLQMHIHEDLQEDKERSFWIGLLGVKEGQFYRTQIKKNPEKGQRKKIEYHGTLQVRVTGADLFYYIEGLMQGIKNI